MSKTLTKSKEKDPSLEIMFTSLDEECVNGE